jgi:hypothetical protein
MLIITGYVVVQTTLIVLARIHGAGITIITVNVGLLLALPVVVADPLLTLFVLIDTNGPLGRKFMLASALRIATVHCAALAIITVRVRRALGVAVGDGIVDTSRIGIAGVQRAVVLIVTNDLSA